MNSTKNEVVVRIADYEDQQRWDAYVMHHPEASPYHLFAWKAAVEESYGHNCYYLYSVKNDRMVGVLPLVHIRLRGIVDELTALPYCDVGNCLSDSNSVQDALLSEALNLRHTLNCRKLCLRGPLQDTELKNAFFHEEASGKVRMMLDLPSSSGELFAGFKSKLRSQIHKAEKNDISFRWSGLNELESIYAVFSRNMHDLGSPVHAKCWLKSILSHYAHRAKVGVTQFQERVVGMGIILAGGPCVSIPWASTLREYNHLNPNMLLYWKMLEFSVENGYRYFDFGRSTENEGTYRFKRQWGAEPRLLVWYTFAEAIQGRDHNPSDSATTRRMVASLWRKAPLAVANILGPCLRKYISL